MILGMVMLVAMDVQIPIPLTWISLHVTGSVHATGHGLVTYYTVPFRKGIFSLSWKARDEERVVLVFDGRPDGKATRALKVCVNGAPGKGKDKKDVLALVPYDGRLHADKKATIVKYDHHSACNPVVRNECYLWGRRGYNFCV